MEFELAAAEFGGGPVTQVTGAPSGSVSVWDGLWKTSGFSGTASNKAKAGFDTAAMNLILGKKGNFRAQS